MKWFFIFFGILAGLVGLYVVLFAPAVVLIPFTLLFGCVPAVGRLASQWPFKAMDILIFTAGCLLLLAGSQYFLQQVTAWKFRWTLAFAGALSFVLLSIMCVVGIAHQLGWILLSSEPVLKKSRSVWSTERADLLYTAYAVSGIAQTNQPSDAAVLLQDDRLPETLDARRPWEKYHAMSLHSNGQHFAVLWPRDQQMYELVGGAVIGTDGQVSIQNTNVMSPLILSAQAHATKSP